MFQLWIMCKLKYQVFYRMGVLTQNSQKTPVPESLFNIVIGFKLSTLLKGDLAADVFMNIFLIEHRQTTALVNVLRVFFCQFLVNLFSKFHAFWKENFSLSILLLL